MTEPHQGTAIVVMEEALLPCLALVLTDPGIGPKTDAEREEMAKGMFSKLLFHKAYEDLTEDEKESTGAFALRLAKYMLLSLLADNIPLANFLN